MSGRGSARGRGGAGPAIRGARGAATGARGGGSVGSHSVWRGLPLCGYGLTIGQVLAASHVETVGQRRMSITVFRILCVVLRLKSQASNLAKGTFQVPPIHTLLICFL